jgi:hypothetical protein
LQTPIGLTGNPLWKRTGQHGNVWLKAHLTLPIDSKIPNYRIAIEAIVGKGNKGDVAIDEIVFTPNRQCSSVSEFGNLVTHYCDFETSTCNYLNELTGKFNRAKPASTNDDPNIDNTIQTLDGYYMQYKVNIFIIFLLTTYLITINLGNTFKYITSKISDA